MGDGKGSAKGGGEVTPLLFCNVIITTLQNSLLQRTLLQHFCNVSLTFAVNVKTTLCIYAVPYTVSTLLFAGWVPTYNTQRAS